MQKLLYILLYIALLPLQVYGQEGVVVDAGTGETLPYATLYVSPSCGTMSNADGGFVLDCSPDDEVRISYIGYKTLRMKASELPSTIRMQPLSTTLKEVTVSTADNILCRLVNKLHKEARRKQKAKGQYFFRLITQYPGTDELAEAFISARSCVQMRDIFFHSGRRGLLQYEDMEGPDLKGLGRTNLHYFLRLAPVLVNMDVWGNSYVPADFVLDRRHKVYDVSCTSFTEDDGTEICQIVFTHKPNVKQNVVLDGTLYVDRKKCRLLRFDGELHNLNMRVYDQAHERSSSTPVVYTMHVDYSYDHGFCEIANMSGVMMKDDVKVHHLLFNLGDRKMKFSNSLRVGNNMLQTIDKVGCDSTLWSTTDIVKRTKAEERIAFGVETTSAKPDPEPDEKPDTILQSAMRQLLEGSMPLRRSSNPTRIPKRMNDIKVIWR